MSISQSKSISDALETLSEAGAPAPRRREAAATIITRLRSETSRAFQASYVSRLNRIDSDLFRCGVRAFFGLPPVIFDSSSATYCSETGCRLQLCAPCLDAGRPRDECKIFPDGSHCQSDACKARRPAYANHQATLYGVAHYLQSFAFGTKCDPPTRKLLLDKYDDVTCRYLFPKNVASRPLQLLKEIQEAAERARGALDRPTKDIIMERVKKLRSRFGNSVTGRKVDLLVESPLSTSSKIVGDVTIRHPLAPSNEANTFRFCKKVAEDTLAHRASVASPQPMDLATSLTLTNAEKSKHQTYRVLMKLVRYEHGVARLPKPDFYPMALTSFGEWSASLFKFLKDCTSQYYARASVLARAGFYTDDCSLPERKSSFVCGFKDVMACQTIAALGRLMFTAGDPVGNNPLAPIQA